MFLCAPCPASWPCFHSGCLGQDLVLCQPPPQFYFPRLAVDTVWYCRIMFMFRVHWRTDEDIAAIIPQCSAMDAVMLEVLSACNLTPSSNKHNRMVIYAPKPLPRVYIMPCEAILGKLPVVPFGDTGTFNAKLPAEWLGRSARYAWKARNRIRSVERQHVGIRVGKGRRDGDRVGTAGRQRKRPSRGNQRRRERIRCRRTMQANNIGQHLQ